MQAVEKNRVFDDLRHVNSGQVSVCIEADNVRADALDNDSGRYGIVYRLYQTEQSEQKSALTMMCDPVRPQGHGLGF